MLQKAGRKAEAVNILAGDDTALKAAAAQVMAGKRLQTGVVTPAEGIAKLFSRLAADIGSDRPSQIALAVVRLATFLAPLDAEGWLITADMLAADDKPEASLEPPSRSDEPRVGQGCVSTCRSRWAASP